MKKRQLRRHYIRQWRERRGLSLRKLADQMEYEPGVPLTSHANLQRIELFQQPYTQEILEALSDALGVTIRDLLEVDPTKAGEVVDMIDIYGKATPDQRAEMRRYGEFIIGAQKAS